MGVVLLWHINNQCHWGTSGWMEMTDTRFQQLSSLLHHLFHRVGSRLIGYHMCGWNRNTAYYVPNILRTGYPSLTLQNRIEGLHEVHVAHTKASSHGDVHESLKGTMSNVEARQRGKGWRSHMEVGVEQHGFTLSLNHSSNEPLTHSQCEYHTLIHSLTHSLTQTLTHSFTHSI